MQGERVYHIREKVEIIEKRLINLAGSPFGVRRIINNKPRSPHTGVDIIAPCGTEVFASNHGEVVFIGDSFSAENSL
jgi:hypothetical protein